MIKPGQVEDIQSKQREGVPCDNEIMELFTDNQALINYMMRGYISELESDDMRQEAFIALLEALKKYDPDKGGTFAAYWSDWIRARFARLRAAGYNIPEYLLHGIAKYKRVVAEYESAHGYQPDREYIIRAMDCKASLVELVERSLDLDGVAALDKTLETVSGESFTLRDTLTADNDTELEAVSNMFRGELQGVWEIVAQILPPEDVEKVKRVYKDGMSYKEAAEASGVDGVKFHTAMSRSMERMKRQRAKFKPYFDPISDGERYSQGVKGCGVGAFKHSGMSATERAAFRIYEKNERRLLRRKKQYKKLVEETLREAGLVI